MTVRTRRMTPTTRSTTWSVASALLRYPDEELAAALPAIARVARTSGIPNGAEIAALAERMGAGDLVDLQSRYVDRFDLGRTTSLFMSWHQFGDRRQRGWVLLNLQARYAQHGFAPASGELPDWLPMMLEFAADAPEQVGRELLEDWRAPIELVRRQLHVQTADEAVIFDAVSATLSALGHSLKDAVERLLRDGPPGEEVGLLPFGPDAEMAGGMLPSCGSITAGRPS